MLFKLHLKQAGPVLFRVMEGITSYLIPGGIIMLILIGLSAFHFNHLFVWADPEVVAHDKLNEMQKDQLILT